MRLLLRPRYGACAMVALILVLLLLSVVSWRRQWCHRGFGAGIASGEGVRSGEERWASRDRIDRRVRAKRN